MTDDLSPALDARKRFACTRRKFLAAAVLAAGGAVAYGNWDANNLETNTLTLPQDALPNLNGLRILHFSDLHNNRPLLKKALQNIPALKPDFIFFTGDLITDFERLSRTRELIDMLKTLVSVAPTYAILGNHDTNKISEVTRVYDASGVLLLRNASVDLRTPQGNTLRVIGLGDWTEGDEHPELCMQPRSAVNHLPILLLSHNPESRHVLKNYAWDLMLAGHTHGGQIGNPFTGKPISLRSDMAGGLYKEDGRHIFVSRGVGNIGGLRYFCPPEINLLIVPPHRDTPDSLSPLETSFS